MDIKEIVACRSYKINLGNYDNVDVFVSVKADIDPLDDPDEAVAELAARVERAALAQLMSVYRARGKKASEAEVRRRHGILA